MVRRLARRHYRHQAVPAGFADAAGPGSVIDAADFGITPDTRRFRDLLTNG
jgi:hypothetical protein